MAKVLFITLYDPSHAGTRCLAAYLQQQGHEAHLLHLKTVNDALFTSEVEQHHGYQMCTYGFVLRSWQDVSPITPTEYALLAQAVATYKPDIVGISARSLHDHLMPTLVPLVKKAMPNCLIAAGGFGPTLNTEHYLQQGVDAVVRGDGEEALDELAHAVEQHADWGTIANLSFLRDGTVQHNPLRPQKKDIDVYPPSLYGNAHCSWIEKDTLHSNEDVQGKTPTYITNIGRGCIGKCTYCCGGQWYGQYKKDNNLVFKRRNRSFESVFKELKSIDRKKWQYIMFTDELFAAPKQKIIDFFKQYKKDIDLPFFIYMSYENMLQHDEMFDTVLNAGWNSTGIGLQSGSEKLCRELYDRKNKNKDYLAYAQKLFDHNVFTDIHIIGGNCYETEEDFNLTLDVVRQLPFSITDPRKNRLLTVRLKPHPKTPILSLAPQVLSKPMPAKQWLYRAALCECRRIMNDEQFNEVRSMRLYKDQPDTLLALYRYLLEKMQKQYFTSLAQQHEGAPLIVYGSGELYQQNKHYFTGCNIAAVLLDKEYIQGKSHIDGHPVLALEHIHQLDDTAPIVIFSQLATMLQRKLERQYGIAKEHIHTCTTILPKDTYF